MTSLKPQNKNMVLHEKETLYVKYDDAGKGISC